jgi:toxin-antitoxin system PIN domain toxin
MRILDANVLLHAIDEQARSHDVARTWLDSALTGSEPVGFAWVVMLAFVRLSTHPSVFPAPLDVDRSVGVLGGWLAQPAAVVLEPTLRHLEILRGLLGPAGTAGNLVNDAHLAALAVEHGAEIVTFDRDFGRFPGLKWRPPDAPSLT